MQTLNLCCLLTIFSCVTCYPSSGIERIVGGQNAKPHIAPYIVSVRFTTEPNVLMPSHICGGIILNGNWIVTAGHCINGLPEGGRLSMMAGSHDFSVLEFTEQHRIVDKLIVHPNYTGGIGPSDIGLIRTDYAFEWSDYVKPILLPEQNLIPSGDATLFGWGSTSMSNTTVDMPNILQTATIPIIPYKICEELQVDSPIDNTNLCTGPLNGHISACVAYSGGPLVQQAYNGDPQLIGIVSWGPFPCGVYPNGLSVYVRVSAFVDWMKNIIQKN